MKNQRALFPLPPHPPPHPSIFAPLGRRSRYVQVSFFFNTLLRIAQGGAGRGQRERGRGRRGKKRTAGGKERAGREKTGEVGRVTEMRERGAAGAQQQADSSGLQE